MLSLVSLFVLQPILSNGQKYIFEFLEKIPSNLEVLTAIIICFHLTSTLPCISLHEIKMEGLVMDDAAP